MRVAYVLLIALSAHAGVIQGVVLEHASGRPVARTLVRLDSVPTPGAAPFKPQTLRAGRSGQFVFAGLPPGSYVLTAVRDGYFPASYGQRRPVGHGRPIEVTADSTLFAELRLRQKGAITGRVLDENGVAAPRVSVTAYRARLPLRSAGSAVSDDRGVYRIHGLEPGRYWVRSGAHTLEDSTGWLPTWGPQGRETKDARVHTVTVDSETAYADVSPEPGMLFSLGGLITCDQEASVIVTTSSEVGQRSTQTSCGSGYGFQSLAPGAYEIFATTHDGKLSGFLEMHLGGSFAGANISLSKSPVVEFQIRNAGSRAPMNVPVTIMARRRNLAETGAEQQLPDTRVMLAPGYWEIVAEPPAGYFVESIVGGYPRRRGRVERSADRFEVFVEPRFSSSVSISLSDQGGRITGTVKSEGKAVGGVPVFLWPVAEAARRSLGGPLMALTNTEGAYGFHSLPPGAYRTLASFDVYEFEEDLVELSKAPLTTVKPGTTAELELALWDAPW